MLFETFFQLAYPNESTTSDLYNLWLRRYNNNRFYIHLDKKLRNIFITVLKAAIILDSEELDNIRPNHKENSTEISDREDKLKRLKKVVEQLENL